MTRDNPSPTSAATESGIGDAGAVQRRTVIKAAAWSLPVIAVAVAAPAANASDLWNVRVHADCFGGILGQTFLPGFEIRETANVAPPTSLSFTQTLTYTGSFDWSILIPGSKAANRYGAEVVIGRPALALYTLAANVSGFQSPGVAYSTWVPNPNALPFGQDPLYTEVSTTPPDGLGIRHTVFTLTFTRQVTVSSLGAGGVQYIAYLFTSGATLPGAAVTNTLSANPGSGGFNPNDNVDVLTNSILSLTCS